MQGMMTGYIISATPKSFSDTQTKETINGLDLLVLDESTGETQRTFIKNDKPKGYNARQLATIKGKKIRATFKTQTFDGKVKTTLQEIVELE